MTKAKSKAEAGRFAKLLYRMHTFPKPLIARVHGAAFAGGMGLVAACDLVVAAEEAEFCLPEVRIGLVPAMISPYIVRAMGEQQARRYVLTGERLGAREAHRIGFVHECVPADRTGCARGKVRRAARRSAGPQALARSKKLLAKVAKAPISPRLGERNGRACWPRRAPATKRARASARSSRSAGRTGAREATARAVFVLLGAAAAESPASTPPPCAAWPMRTTPMRALILADGDAGQERRPRRPNSPRRARRCARRSASSPPIRCSWSSARASTKCRRSLRRRCHAARRSGRARRRCGESLAQYRDAALMRPGSPYVWASIALLKLRLERHGFRVLRRARARGALRALGAVGADRHCRRRPCRLAPARAAGDGRW